MTHYLLLAASFLCTFAGCLLIIRLARRQDWLDRPNARSSHARPTPTSGGIAIAIVFTAVTLVAFIQEAPAFNHYLVLLFAALIAALGLADDLFHLGILPRLATQMLVVGGALALFGVPSFPLPGVVLDLGWAGYLMAALAFLWFINLFNFMDGIDGLAASETLFICLAAMVISLGGDSRDLHSLLQFLAASVAGFLALNTAPARLFMGDIGSNFLGYLLGVAALASSAAGLTPIWVWGILAGVFIVDASYTLVMRILRGETLYHAHRSHVYQLAARSYGSHGKVVVLVQLINCGWLLPLAWFSQLYPQWGGILLLLAWLPLLLLARLISRSQTVSGIAQ